MAQTPASKYQCDGTMDHTPAGAVTAGDVIFVNDTCGIAPRDIAANALGCLDIEGVYLVPKVTGAISKGDRIYWNATGSPAAGDNNGTGAAAATALGKYMGIAYAAALSGDYYVAVGLNQPSDDEMPGASTAAAGSSTSDAGALPAGTSRFYPTTAADDTKGVKIDVADQVTGRTLFIGNGVSNKILKVYGPTGAVINGAAADAAFSSVSGKGVWIKCLSGSGNTWSAA